MRSRTSWKPSDLAAPFVLLAMLTLSLSCTMRQLTRVEGDSFPRAAACGACHVEIHREWIGSPHARAWTNPHYRQATDNYRFQKCLSCHAPAPQYTATRPAVRTTGRETGVTCVSCHLEEGTLAGPIDPDGLVAPHPVKVDPARYRDSRFCGRCHEGTLKQWLASDMPDRSTCQDCHMPAVHRKMTQATGPMSRVIVAFERAADQKRHTFELTPQWDEPPVTVSVAWAGRAATVTVINKLPHNLPTGDFGVRVVAVEVIDIAHDGGARPLAQWELTRSGGGAIPAGQAKQWRLVVPDGTRELGIRLVRRGRDGADAVTIFEMQVPVP